MVAGSRGSEVAGLPNPNPSQPEPRDLETPTLRRLYAIVLAELALTVAIFYAFTKYFE